MRLEGSAAINQVTRGHTRSHAGMPPTFQHAEPRQKQTVLDMFDLSKTHPPSVSDKTLSSHNDLMSGMV